jgi:hypothetical protein
MWPMGVVLEIAVIEPGNQADAILACLSERFGEIAVAEIREYQLKLLGVDVTKAVETVTKAAEECDQDWHRYIAIAAPPGPG